MRGIGLLMLGGAGLGAASPALAADALKFGPPPAWVVPQPLPPAKPSDAAFKVLLSNAQIAVDPGKVVTYGEAAIKIQNPQGLAAGNLSLSWQPATDTVTVNKLLIRRGDKVIDVLKSGQTFTVLRRETNLDAAMLDGTLTANIQPEGLQEGDIIEFATTTEHVDPVLKSHVETMFGSWNGTPIESAYSRLIWPNGLKLNVRQTSALPPARRSSRDGKTIFELAATDIEPLLPPSGAPDRFKVGRLVEASDLSSWADLSDLMAPLCRTAAVIPASGPLHDEVERIRTSTADPKRRAEQALALTQDRVRYVALLMGQGGYVPATAEATWSRRFGDCKAKTALLLAMLHQLGIEADPVLVQIRGGDMIRDRLPILALFNHVLVRAQIGGKTYWLDGTRAGDTALDDIAVPEFGWGLPLVKNAQLIRIVPPPLNDPDSNRRIEVDASAGLFTPAQIAIVQNYHGDVAVQFNALYVQMTEAQRDQLFSEDARRYFDRFSLTAASFQFDKAKRDLTITTKGSAKLGWKDGWLFIPGVSVAYNPDFNRPSGPSRDAPFSIGYPDYNRSTVTFRLPPGVAKQQKLPTPVHETLAGVEYQRTGRLDGDTIVVEMTERSLMPEIAYQDALAAEDRLRTLDKDDVYFRLPENFQPTEGDEAAIVSGKPTTTSEKLFQAMTLMDQGKMPEALAVINRTITDEPKNPVALAARALANAWQGKLDAAKKDVAAAQAIDPGNGGVLSAAGLVAELQQNCAAAVEAFSKAIAAEPGNAFHLGHRAICYHKLGKEAEALADSELALKGYPAWMDLRVMRANILFTQGRRGAVADEADLLMRENPQSNFAFVAAGKIYGRLQMHDEALKAFDRALAIKPEAYVYINRSEVRPRSDRAGKIADLDQSLKLDPTNPDALAEKAELLMTSGDFKQAVEAYDRAVKDAPDNSRLRVSRALALYRLGQTAEAQKALATFESSAKTADDFNSLCWTKATGGILLESALANCRSAVRLAPDSSSKLDSLGFVLLRLGKFGESIDVYTKALAGNRQSMSLMGRAIAYARSGDRTHAEADRTEALKVDPDVEARFADYGLKL
ncbi:MAG TPA: DUF3857 domain-containing protein [Sphingomicrobium sp.]